MPTTGHDTARTRIRVGGALIAFAWLLTAATVVALMIVLPGHQVDDYAAWIILGGLLAGVAATVLIGWAILGLDVD